METKSSSTFVKCSCKYELGEIGGEVCHVFKSENFPEYRHGSSVLYRINRKLAFKLMLFRSNFNTPLEIRSLHYERLYERALQVPVDKVSTVLVVAPQGYYPFDPDTGEPSTPTVQLVTLDSSA
ncbi:hypothetical protein CBL_07095 [Carabus blaptoides fortunei]